MPSKQVSEPQNVPPPEGEETEEQVSNRPFWSGTISFGLVSIPVDLYPAVRSSRISLRMLSPEGVPLQRHYVSSEDGKEIPAEHMVRGYETESEEYVVVSDEELERLIPEKSRYIELRQFVEIASIHPLYFEKAYFLAPSGESTRAYRLLASVMEESKRAGVADFVMRGKAYPAAIFADSGILRLQTLRYHDEVRTPEDVGLPKAKASEDDVKHFSTLIKKHTSSKLDKKVLKDVESEQMQKLIEGKRKKGKDVVKVEESERQQAGVVDIMEMLKRSLAGSKAKEEVPKKTAKSAGRARKAAVRTRKRG
jgi:DNA end-binding protein Ku